MYLVGAIRNAELAPAVYPGWRCRYYLARSVPADVVERLSAFAHVEIVRREDPVRYTGYCWRFEAAADPEADAINIRDTDSRLNLRERAAVDAWLASGAAAHVMRDHPNHEIEMMAGMWGVRKGVLTDIVKLLALYYAEGPEPPGDDQRFLAKVVMPRIQHSLVEHDEYFAQRPFPTRRRGSQYVGQPFDEHERPLIPGPTAMRRRLGRAARVVRERLLARNGSAR